MMSATQRGLQIVAISAWTVVAVAAGAAAGQAGLQLGQAAAGLGQGLVQAAGLLGVQVRRVGEHRAAGHAERGDGGVDDRSARGSGRRPRRR